MANQRARCTNFGNCTKADHNEMVDIGIGGTPLCPVCGKPLTIVPTTQRNPGGLVGFVLVGLLIAAGALIVINKMHGSQPTPTTSTTPAPPAGTDFNQSSNAEPTLNPGDALMYFERSDETWLKQAAQDYNGLHPGQPRIVLDFRGSREGKQDILFGKGQPVIWNPADQYWVDKLNMDWTNPSVGNHSRQVIADGDARTILSTRFVLVAWSDRAGVLQAAMEKPEYRGKTWQLLYDAATKGWSAIGGDPSWGKLKLAQSDPTLSNGGQTALALMFNEYRKSHPDATPSSAGFLKFMRGIEGAVDRYQDTTSKAISALIQGGRGQYDVATGYEQNAVAQVDQGHTDIKVIYPDPTVEIDFPAAILSTTYVTDSQRDMASSFIAYLLTPGVQKQALTDGFRPVLADMRTDVDDALSNGARGSAGFQLDPPTVIRPVGTKLIDDLLFQWYKIYGSESASPQ
ncbi:MAG: substrate-binding domain-containing protein [Capsulimonadaceae bacterium]